MDDQATDTPAARLMVVRRTEFIGADSTPRRVRRGTCPSGATFREEAGGRGQYTFRQACLLREGHDGEHCNGGALDDEQRLTWTSEVLP